ncbi:unnamed protein product [Brassica oleracea]
MLVIRIAVGICRDLRKVMHDYVNKGSNTTYDISLVAQDFLSQIPW